MKYIDDATPIDAPHVNGTGHGLIPRDYSALPVGTYGAKVNFPLIPRSEWSDRIKEKKELKSRTSDVLRRANYGSPIKALYQDGFGYCWAYSGGTAVTAVRALMGLPYKVLSPFAVAHIIKNGRNEGGWCGLSAEWIIKNGIPDVSVWPNLKSGLNQDNAAMRANAALNKIDEGYIDLDASPYDRNLTVDQLATLLLMNVPCQVDFNWWSHSVCALDWDEYESGAFGPTILNSHGEDYEDQLIQLKGSRGVPDGAVGHAVARAA